PAETAALSFADALPYASDAGKISSGKPATETRGNPERAFASAAVQLDLTFSTEAAHHNALEPAAAIAAWHHRGFLTVWNTTQFSYGDAAVLGEAFAFGVRDRKLRIASQAALGIELDAKLRVIAPLIGGGFGGKGANMHLLLAAMAAKVANAPVKLVLTREQTYAMMPYRSAVVQHLHIGASPEGCLVAVLHDSVVQNSNVGSFVEPVGELTPHLYACKHLRTTHKIACLDINAPGWMRAPGAAPGMFGLECSMDELAEKVGIDPVELRLRNYTDVDPANGRPWSSNSLKQCYRAAGETIGWWSDRNPRPRSLQEDGCLIGFGMASAAYQTMQFPASARVTLTQDGLAVVQTAAHEIGQGAITALTQIAAESLCLPLDQVRLEFGDTDLPFSPMTAASSTTLSVGTAIKTAADQAKRDLLLLAITEKSSPFKGLRSREIGTGEGRLYKKTDPACSDTYADLLRRSGRRQIRVKAVTGRTFGKSRYGRSAFGAQFAKVAVDPETGHVHVLRLVGAFAGGRVINPKLARSQLRGGMIWGLGQALMEETVMDSRRGRWVNSNLAEALVPTNSDVPSVDALLIEEDDRRGSSLGAKGLGEIGITGVAAAIANAVYHATGNRIYKLPIRLDKLLPQ
ncbi:MAG: xanthine dehydrogenase family protein molybdopterin-binding subunit, partial [Acidobacteriota bacterium]|nr:xanthine dehydrogenase family protein molybdopterin-binding subunit [Acidobacteriota bacterium]